MLGEQGSNTYMLGTYHQVPSELEPDMGPYDCCTLGCGFEQFDSFMGGDTHQYYLDPG